MYDLLNPGGKSLLITVSYSICVNDYEVNVRILKESLKIWDYQLCMMVPFETQEEEIDIVELAENIVLQDARGIIIGFSCGTKSTKEIVVNARCPLHSLPKTGKKVRLWVIVIRM